MSQARGSWIIIFKKWSEHFQQVEIDFKWKGKLLNEGNDLKGQRDLLINVFTFVNGYNLTKTIITNIATRYNF